jgi:hypothetical protein
LECSLADYGFFKLECKTKASNGMEFTTSGNHNSDSGKVSGSLETKYKWSDYGKLVCLVAVRYHHGNHSTGL